MPLSIRFRLSFSRACSVSRSTHVISGFMDIVEELREPLLESTKEASKALTKWDEGGWQPAYTFQACKNP